LDTKREHRNDYRILFSLLSSSQHAVLAYLAAGLSVADCLTSAAEQTAPDRKQVADSVRAWLRDWVDGGFFLY
jgi:hypothetical protein